MNNLSVSTSASRTSSRSVLSKARTRGVGFTEFRDAMQNAVGHVKFDTLYLEANVCSLRYEQPKP